MPMKTRFFCKVAALAAAVSGLAVALPAAAEIVASEAWSRATVPGAKEGVGYLVLKNTGEESRKLLTITSTVSDMVMLHRSSIDSNGVARMWPLAGLTIEPGESVRFAPGGLHVMFRDIKNAFAVGQKIPLTLRFEDEAGPLTVMLEVRPLVPAAAETHSQRAR
jgi:copper(I)-binding protein